MLEEFDADTVDAHFSGVLDSVVVGIVPNEISKCRRKNRFYSDSDLDGFGRKERCQCVGACGDDTK